MSIAVQVLLALAPYLAPVIVSLLTYLVVQAIHRLPANQRPVVESIVRSSVSATAQMASDQLNNAGKRQLAAELIDKQLGHYGIKVPDAEVNALVEEAVGALKLAQKAAVVPIPIPLPPNQ